LPAPADTSAPSYWQECDRQISANAPATGGSAKPPAKTESKPTDDSKAGEEEDKAKNDDKRDSEVPDPKTETQSPRAFAAPPIQLVSMQTPVMTARQVADDDEKSTSDESPSDRQETDRQKADREKAQDAQEKQTNPFQLPSILPGANTPPLNVPRQANDAKGKDKAEAEKERDAAFAKLYPVLIPQPQIAAAAPDASLGMMGLEELQQLTRDNHPGVRAAAAAVETARGLMIQAGLPPNPNFGYEADTVRTALTNGYHGAYIQQTIITARKLGLAAEAAAVDHANASLNLQKVWYSAISEVRRQYFNTLSARQRLQLAEGLLTLSDRAYQTQIELVKAGEAAAYEPLQLRVLTTQARATVVQAQQDSLAAWRSLAAAVGVPSLPHSALAGRIDCKVPEVDYDTAVARMIAVHTDLQTARNLVGKNRTLVTLADRTPIPDVNVGVVIQHDYTFNPGTTTYNLVLGGAIPVFNQNQGNRVATRADLVKSTHTVNDTQNQLIGQLAPVFSKYQANRQLASSFRTDALADQVRAYRGIYQRYHTDPTGIGFNDIIVAQQTLAATLTQYLSILQAQWQGTVDVGELLQVDDLFQLGPTVEVAQIPAIVEAPAEEVTLADGEQGK
jgi:cobalt-zinc-cadmium efflux system outer membrane protein